MDTKTTVESPVSTRFLMRFMWLSIATAVATVTIKGAAAWITQSAGLMSDALESTVNLVAAIVALWALNVSAKPADAEHEFGHGKAEYFSSAVEGALIFVAAGGIIAGAILKLLNPVPLEELGFGLALALGASVLNLITGMVLLRAGKKHRSIVLEADGRHLLTDVLTSIGVLVAMGIILIGARLGQNWEILDPIIAIGVGINILWTGYTLMRRSVVGLLDAALPADEVAIIHTAMERVVDRTQCRITQLRTREAGRQRFIEAIVEVPGAWTVHRGHELTDALEREIEQALPGTEAHIHVEPLGAGSVAGPIPPTV
ncbi:cation diffusion facilitator family transporter [Propioniciclava tarda]|uniref:Cation transporter n=1 Tax=Propioniciclava tarda TaxID=433330 RepID=A0A4Q9KJH3_PROTD|nr:cation diffusion facilitator family transporter [Propioniciclava tarda]TBT94602.1 cation transporter [Propioniciclava tarda]SMO66434.1 cation diffusion facilitator family transporter [Propioniciclava tarda]